MSTQVIFDQYTKAIELGLITKDEVTKYFGHIWPVEGLGRKTVEEVEKESEQLVAKSLLALFRERHGRSDLTLYNVVDIMQATGYAKARSEEQVRALLPSVLLALAVLSSLQHISA